MNVREIIKKYLDDNGYDGLCREECGCGKDDLFPCGDPGGSGEYCVPAYIRECPDCVYGILCCYATDKSKCPLEEA